MIREVCESDIDSVIILCQKHAEHERMPYNSANKKELLTKAIFSEVKQLHCFVVEYNYKIVAYFTYTFDFSTWDAANFLHLDCLYIEPEYRGLGIGKRAIELLKEISSKHNCVNIQWQTPVFNEDAIAFYKKIGALEKQKIRYTLQSSKVNFS